MTANSPAAWHQAYERGVPTDPPPADCGFDRLLGAAAADAPGSVALEFHLRRLNFAELDAQVSRAAAALQGLGLGPGEAVVIALPNCPTGVVAALGALRAGLVAVLVDPAAPHEAARGRMARLAPRLVIADPALPAELAELLARLGVPLLAADPAGDLPPSLRLVRALARPGRRHARAFGPGGDWWARLRAAPAEPAPVDIDPDSPALLLAGGEADPQGTLFTHRHLVAGALQIRLWLTDAMPAEGTWLVLAALASAFGFVVGLGAAMLLRHRAILLPTWAPAEIEDALRCLRPSHVVADGGTLRRLVADPALARLDPRSIRAWFSPAPLAGDCVATFEGGTGIGLCLGYAAPGVAGLATCNPINGRRASGSIGLPLPGVDARLVAPGGPGHADAWLELAGPNIAAPAWLATRRPARIDAAGYIFLEPAAHP